MPKIAWIMTTFVVASVIVVGVLMRVGDSPMGISDPQPIQSLSDGWACPMHFKIKQGQPGACPICKMDLVRVERQPADGSHSAMRESVRADAYQLRRIGARLGEAQIKAHYKVIKGRGRILLSTDIQETFQSCGMSRSRLATETDPELRKDIQAILDSCRTRLIDLGVPSEKIEAVMEGKVEIRAATIYREGEPIWIQADIPTEDLDKVTVGTQGRIRAPFLPSEGLSAEVRTVSKYVQPNQPTTTARILVSKPSGRIKFEAFVEVSLDVPLGSFVTVPSDAVFDDGKSAWVFVSIGPDTLEPRKVELAFRDGELAAIRRGLKRGEKVAVSANFLIDSESRIRAR